MSHILKSIKDFLIMLFLRYQYLINYKKNCVCESKFSFLFQISLNFLKFVVLDEADRMLDMGFSPDVQFIFGRMSDQYDRQVMMFSATFPNEVQQLASNYMKKNYLFLTVGVVGAACSDVEQKIVLVNSPNEEGQTIDKDDALMEILMDLRDDNGRLTKKVLIFVEMKRKVMLLVNIQMEFLESIVL